MINTKSVKKANLVLKCISLGQNSQTLDRQIIVGEKELHVFYNWYKSLHTWQILKSVEKSTSSNIPMPNSFLIVTGKRSWYHYHIHTNVKPNRNKVLTANKESFEIIL